MPKFRKKPVVIEAVQWTGDNEDEVKSFVFESERPTGLRFQGSVVNIQTLEGSMAGSADDWIIQGVSGEFYPCKPDIFDATYEAVSDDA